MMKAAVIFRRHRFSPDVTVLICSDFSSSLLISNMPHKAGCHDLEA